MRTNKGITLVALVITIIVLLILAGITINLTLGQDGIITKSQEAKEETQLAKIRETVELELSVLNSDYLLEEIQPSIQNALEHLQSKKILETIMVEEWIGITPNAYIVELRKNVDNQQIEIEDIYLNRDDVIKIGIQQSTQELCETLTLTLTAAQESSGITAIEMINGERKEFLEAPKQVSTTFDITQNGVYSFKITTKDGKEKIRSISIRNITTFVESITLNKTKMTIALNQTETLIPTIQPEEAHNKQVKWESSDPSVVEVNEAGEITSQKLGKAIITCTALDGSNITATCEITVAEPMLLAKAVSIGDYVDYPIQYSNYGNTSYKGWRVLYVKSDSVYIISAGTPMSSAKVKEGTTSQQTIDSINQVMRQNNTFFDNRYVDLETNVRSVNVNDFAQAGIKLGVEGRVSNTLAYNGSTYLLATPGDKNWPGRLIEIWRHSPTLGTVKDAGYPKDGCGLRPIIRLKTSVMTTGAKNESGAWELIEPK